MRTDSVRVSSEALDQVRGLIGSKFGPTYLPEKPNFYKSKKDAQEAHEAVRPTDASRTPADVKPFLSEDLFKLYQLIWQRFVASQMVPAVFDQTTIDIAAGDYTFRATGSVQKFDGYLAVYQVSAEDDEDAEADASKALLPAVTEGEDLRLETLRPEQHFTEPPPRYNDATLVKELEEKGIGRPSTYASIISTIVDREYVTKDQGRFSPTMLGEKVSILLVKSFEDIFDVGFTARMEEELDEIEEGKLPWKKSVKEFYGRFEQDLEQAKGEMESYKAGIPDGTESARSADKANFSNASAATDFSWAARAIRIAISSAISLPNCRRGWRRGTKDRNLRQLRARNGDQARPVGNVFGLHGLSRLQNDAALESRNAQSSAAG